MSGILLTAAIKENFSSSLRAIVRRYLHWLFEAKKRFGLCVLDYMVTSNHIHLLVKDTGPDVIAKSMQLTKTETRSKRSNRSIASLRSRRFTSEHQSIRDVMESDGSYALREPAEAYAGNLNDKTEALRHQNTFVWDEKVGDART